MPGVLGLHSFAMPPRGRGRVTEQQRPLRENAQELYAIVIGQSRNNTLQWNSEMN